MEPTSSTNTDFIDGLVKRQTLVLGIAIFFAIAWTALYLQFTVDDAFISFRYGKTLIHDHVWNWNPSGPRAEAYTSFTYTLLSIVPAILHISFPLFFKLVGLSCVGWMAYRLWTQSSSRFAALLGVLLLAINPWIWLHAYSGLETPLYILLILEAGLSVKHAQLRSPLWAYTLFFLLPLTRPEGAVFAAAAIALYWHRRGPLPRGNRALGLALLAGFVYFVIRWQYFHSLLPNPFYIKVTGHSLHDTLSSLASNLSWSRGYILILAFVLLFARHLYVRVFAVCSLLILLLLFAPHGMMMNYADRYWFQLTLPILLLFLIVEDIARLPRAATVLAAISIVTISVHDLGPMLHMYPSLRDAQVGIGRRLEPFADGHHTLAVGDAGAIPFYSGWVAYDYIGLATNSVAHHGISTTDVANFHPDLVLLYESSDKPNDFDGFGDLQDPVVAYMKQSGDYQFVSASRFQSYYMTAYLRNGTNRHDEIAATLRQNASSPPPAFSLKRVLLQRYVPWSY